jgi:hypothetical protein
VSTEKVVELTEGVFVRTAIANIYIPALRCGFAGYPVNPRWNAVKFHAWKTGREWRQALHCGEMVVRSTDSMLVSLQEQGDRAQSPSPRKWGNPTLLTFYSRQLKWGQLKLQY